MSGTRRARLHCRLGEALAERDAPAGTVAHHLLAGTPVADADLTLDWAERAYDAALAALAYDDAAAMVRRALPHAADPARRANMLVALGDALDRGGERDAAREAFADAADAARASGNHHALTQAALGYKGYAVTVTTPDPKTVAMLEEALATVGDDPAPRAQLLAALALEGYYADIGKAREWSAEAVALARSGGGPQVLAHTLSAHHLALWDGDHTADRLGIATEMARVARAAGDRVALLQARNWRVIDLLEIGKVDDAIEEIETYEREAQELRLARFEWYVPLWRANLAVVRGEYEEGERLSQIAYELGVAAGDGNAPRHRKIQQGWALYEQERCARGRPRLDGAHGVRVPYRTRSVGRLARVAGHQSRRPGGGARVVRRAVSADDFAVLPNDANWHMISRRVRHDRGARHRRPGAVLLERMRAVRADLPRHGARHRLLGPVAHHAGMLAARLGDLAEAERLYTWSIDACERIGAKPRADRIRERLDELNP